MGPPRWGATEKGAIEGGREGDRLGYSAVRGRGNRGLRSILVVNLAKVVNDFEAQNRHDRYGARL